MNLLDFAHNTTSEHGEDGIIQKLFELIGAESKTCVELGALNGTHGSNVWRPIQEGGWRGVLIEADRTYFEKLQKEYEGSEVVCLNAFVSFEGPTSLDALFAQTPLPKEFDLMSLDIDGNDYHLWDSMREYAPRVMVVEYNPTIPNDVLFVQPRDMRVMQGSSLLAIVELGKRKGYELVAVTDTNAIMVKRELYPKVGVADNSLNVLRPHNPYETKLFQLYDGTLKVAGYGELMWHHVPLDEAKLQVLSARKRRYPARVDSRAGVRTFKYMARKLPIYAAVQQVRKWLS